MNDYEKRVRMNEKGDGVGGWELGCFLNEHLTYHGQRVD